MYIVDGVAYAGTKASDMTVLSVKPLDDMMMLVTFASGERRLFDASRLLAYPAFAPLQNESVFKAATIDRGVVVWADGDIDIAPETMYRDSVAYEDMRA